MYVCCEGIDSGEINRLYAWMIQPRGMLENRWNVSKISIIFGDGFVTNLLLANLKNSWNLCPSWRIFHLYKEIWPSKETFVSTEYFMVKEYLKVTLSSSTKEEWIRAYNKARLWIINIPCQLELFDKIYNNPKYYSDHYIRSLRCNLKYQGSITAEKLLFKCKSLGYRSIVVINWTIMSLNEKSTTTALYNHIILVYHNMVIWVLKSKELTKHFQLGHAITFGRLM